MSLWSRNLVILSEFLEQLLYFTTPRATPLTGPLAFPLSYKFPKNYYYVHRPYLYMFMMFLGKRTMCMCAPRYIWPKVAHLVALLALQQVSGSMLCVCHAYQIDTRCIQYIKIYYAFRSHHTCLI